MFQILSNLKREDTLTGACINPNSKRSWYHESCINSDRLLITCGDSWTWGDALGKIKFIKIADPENIGDDYEYRVNHIYGAILAKKINADFLLLAQCGSGNSFFWGLLKNALPQVIKKYKNIDVVITLTENVREYSPAAKYWEHAAEWISDKTIDTTTFMSLLSSFERVTFKKYKELFDNYPQVNFIIGRNFTNTFPENFQYCKQHIPKTWMQIIEENQSTSINFPVELRYMNSKALNNIINFYKDLSLHDRYLNEAIKQQEIILTGLDALDKSILNSKWATRHPNTEAHKLWAEYLFNYIR